MFFASTIESILTKLKQKVVEEANEVDSIFSSQLKPQKHICNYETDSKFVSLQEFNLLVKTQVKT